MARGSGGRGSGGEPATEQIEVSVARAYADAPTLAPDVHRIAPHEEVVLDAAALKARFASTDEARIAAALDAHALQPRDELERAPPLRADRERHEPTHLVRARRRPASAARPSAVWVLTLAALGLAAGIGVALLEN